MDGDEAARLLDRVASAVPIAPAPVGRLVDVARRRRRRRRLTAVAVLVAAGILLALA